MLRITTSKNGAAALAYFNKSLSKQDYYADEKNVAGIWHGKTAQQLGLQGEVTKEQFEKLVHNRIPNQDENAPEQKLTPRDSETRRAGYDFTYNAPKSVSVAHAINNDPALLHAHQAAVSRAMVEVEKDMQTQGKRGENYVTTGNALYAQYDHELTRPVAHPSPDGGEAQYIPDPHVHSHCFLFNATWNEERERYQAVELGNIKSQGYYYEAIYHATFRQEVIKAGYEVELNKNGWELTLVDKEMRDKFSNRTKEIEQEALEKGLESDKAKDQLGARTRHNKNKSATEDDVKKNWNERLTVEQKFNIQSAAGSGVYQTKTQQEHIQLSPESALELSLAHHLQNKSAIEEKRVLADALKKGNFTPEQIQTAFDNRPNILGYHNNTKRIITTREVLNAEKDMIAYAAQQKGKHEALNTAYEPQKDQGGYELNEQQINAVKTVLNSKDGVVMLKGGAGVGKSTLLQEVQNGIHANKKSLFAFAPSAAASREVLRDKGFKGADTIKKLLDDEELQAKLNGQVILVDEAGMVSVQDMNSIMGVASTQNARLILSGDDKQHHSVTAGDAFKLLQDRAKLDVAAVNQVIRQQNNEYREAIQNLANGNVTDGLKQLEKIEAIREIEDKDERYEQIADDYLESLKSPAVRQGKKMRSRTQLIVSPTHKEGQAVTDAVRARLRAEKLIGEFDRPTNIFQPLHYTDAQKQETVNYQDGMQVKFHYNIKGYKAGSIASVVGKDEQGNVLVKKDGQQTPTPLPLDKVQKFAVYRENHATFTEGDMIQMTANTKSMETENHKSKILNNGNRYKITGFTEDGHRILSNGAIISKDEKFIKHGLYSTSISAQGKDADDIFIAQSEDSFGAATNQKQFYVSSSRGVRSCRIYTNSKEDLFAAVERNKGNRETAMSVAAKSASERLKVRQTWDAAVQQVDNYNAKQSSNGESKTTYEGSHVGIERIGGLEGTASQSTSPT